MRNETEYLEAVDQYMHGYCMFMAAALHHRYGFPVGLLTITHADKKERLCHAFVVLPNGKFMDVQGEQTLKEVTSFQEDGISDGITYKVYSPTTLSHLEKLSGTLLPNNEPDVKLALEVAQKYLDRELQNWN